MTIGKQLTSLMVGFTAAAGVAVVVVSLFQVGIQKQTRQMAAEGNRHTKELFAALRSVAGKQSLTQQILREKDPDRIEVMMEDSKKLTGEARGRLQGLRSTAVDLVKPFEALNSADDKCVDSYLKGDAALAQQYLIEEANPAFDAILAAVGGFQEQSSLAQDAAAAAAEQRISRINFFLLVGGGVVGAILFACGMLIVRRVNTSIGSAVADLFAAARETSGAAGQLLESANQQAQGASEQAATLVETSSAGEEIYTMAHRNGESSQQAAQLMQRSQERFNEASRALDAMVSSIEEIHKASHAVAKIMQTVDSIAFQTNILALNAAVEAARAGEVGAGFSVVADEVRNLAQRSAQAAKDTAALTEQSIQLTTEGKRRVAGLVEVMKAITEDERAVAALVAQVSQGSSEQAGGMAQIAKALTEMETVTQRGAAAAEESAAAARQLDSQAHSLNGIVENIAALVGKASS